MDDIPGSHLIVTVHGIRTYGRWQERLEALVGAESNDTSVEFINYKFGYFSVFAFVVPFFRWLVVRRFRNELVKLCTQMPRSRIDLVGHSFGTHIIAWAIQGLSTHPKIVVHTVLLSGSVLRAGFPWRELIGARVGRLINDCGTKDGVLLLSQFGVLFTGMAGRTGFSGATGHRFRNRYSVFGHSGYFEDAQGQPSDDYMKTHWLPLLRGDTPIAEFDNRQPGPFEGLVTLLANNAEPIKLAVYGALLAIPFLVYRSLYLDADQQRKIAEAQRDRVFVGQSLFLADLAMQQRNEGDGGTAMLLAVEALPDIGAGVTRPYVPEAEWQLDGAWRALRERTVLIGHTSGLNSAAFSGDGKRIITGSQDGTARLWDVGSVSR
jgi:hypothetical protein